MSLDLEEDADDLLQLQTQPQVAFFDVERMLVKPSNAASNASDFSGDGASAFALEDSVMTESRVLRKLPVRYKQSRLEDSWSSVARR